MLQCRPFTRAIFPPEVACVVFCFKKKIKLSITPIRRRVTQWQMLHMLPLAPNSLARRHLKVGMVKPDHATSRPSVSGVTQSRLLKVEIRGFKTGHFLEGKTALVGLVTAGPEGYVERPESEPANDDTQFSPSRVVAASDCTRTWDQSRDRRAVFASSR